VGRATRGLWASIDDYDEGAFIVAMDQLIADSSMDEAVAAFERASALDSTGHPDEAVRLYRLALERGLEGQQRRRAVIQMSSSLRNLGHAQESVALLTPSRQPRPISWTTRSARSSRSRSSIPDEHGRPLRSLSRRWPAT
jgi:Tetratrico peptide repeat